MPDSHAHLAAEQAARDKAYREGLAEYHALHNEPVVSLSAQAIAECSFCDDEGYRNCHVCDHKDYSAAAKRGMAAVRAALERGGA